MRSRSPDDEARTAALGTAGRPEAAQGQVRGWISRRGTLLAIFVTALLVAGAWIAVLAHGAAELGPVAKGAFVTDYDGRVLDDGLELLIIQSDGQAYATQARDPFFGRAVESFRTPQEASYRLQRPLFGWLAWMGSLGQSGWVPPAMAVISAAGAGLAAAAAGALLLHRGRNPWFGLLVLLMPGTGSALSFLGPEPLVLGLALCGLVAWERDRTGLAVTLFCLAVLGRESAILVALVPGAAASLRRQWCRALPLLAVPAVLVGWTVFLRFQFDSWPWEAGERRLGSPFAGFSDAVPELWTDTAQNAGTLALGMLIAAAALLIARRDLLVGVVGAHVVFAVFMGSSVWAEVLGFGRVLLPLYVAGAIAVIGAIDIGDPEAAAPPALDASDGALSRPVVH